MDSIDERIDMLREKMLPLQKIYGLKSKTIDERYLEIQKEKKVLENKTKPRIKLPKL